MLSSDGRLTPYNDQESAQVSKVNNLVDSGEEEEDDSAAYIENKRG